MITYASVRQMESDTIYWDGNIYAPHPTKDNRVVKAIGEIDGKHFVYFTISGSAVKHVAERSAQELGGFVVTVDSEFWPNGKDILLAIRKHLGEAK